MKVYVIVAVIILSISSIANDKSTKKTKNSCEEAAQRCLEESGNSPFCEDLRDCQINGW